MPIISRLLLGLFIVLAPGMAGSVPSSNPADSLLREMRQAYGGDHWNHVSALQSEGTETGDGLSGAWQSLAELHHGYYISRWRNEMFSAADGIDAQGRWHQGVSGMIGPYDSDEAKALAISESWLRRFGFLAVQPDASFQLLTDSEEHGRRYFRLQATPTGGRTLTLWIDPSTFLLDHVAWKGSYLLWSQRYADYHAVDGLQLPFRITTTSVMTNGTLHGTTLDVAEHIQALPEVSAGALARPSNTVRDVTMAHGAREAVVPMHLEGGALLIEAKINGKGPMPFILDTGGQALFTREAAKKLGLQATGSGVSAGSGPGSMTTAYTKVAHLTLGNADIRNQAFLIIPFPYSFYQRGVGREPIAGLLGLEIFQRFAVTFDYDHRQLILQPFDHGNAPAARKGDILPIHFTADIPLIRAKLDGKSGIFGVDTGNSGYTLLFPQWAEQQGLLSHYEHGAPYLTGGVGGLYTAHLAHAHSLELGGTTLSDVLALLTRADAGATGNPTEAGNIGQDVLAGFNVHVDYRRAEIVLMPRAKTPIWHYAMAGFRAEKHEDQPDRYQVTAVIPGSPAEQAGLKKGDAIMAIDGQKASALGVGQLWDLISLRPEGVLLTLTLSNGHILKMKLRDIAPH
ncbi:PDZ domain-containing protein [Dyella monticola]|uniref:PDZ domain-containing protein n=1 Tax=Dyella monticola TaxID=1927958 RepID=A0A370X5J6_9GAMM|nr:aspartyl protease family protein [Dyella monticola]RDS83511.1 PDZ domain-containing protein [Dyella monticola]